MSLTLYLVRHGDAVMQAPTDAERPLSSVGEKEAGIAADNLGYVQPEVFLASPYLRAQQTADIIKTRAGINAEIITEQGITPDDHPSGVVDLLDQHSGAESILVVSHNPLMSALSNYLLEGSFHGPVVMGTASVACIEFDVFGVGQGTLKWLKHVS